MMQTKLLTNTMLLLVIGVAALAVVGCNKSEHDHSDGHAHPYTCPMPEHSDVLADKPGNCPKCGMKLVEKK